MVAVVQEEVECTIQGLRRGEFGDINLVGETFPPNEVEVFLPVSQVSLSDRSWNCVLLVAALRIDEGRGIPEGKRLLGRIADLEHDDVVAPGAQ